MSNHKVQFNFSEKALKDLDDLQRQIESPSRAETVRYALKVLQWIADEIGHRNKICVQTPDEGVREVFFPFLSPSSAVDDPVSTGSHPQE